MNKKFLTQQKQKLEQKKQELEESLKSFTQKDTKLKDNWKSQFPKFGDQSRGHADIEENADEVEEYENILPVEYSLELNLKNVNEALEKIKTHKYGICEKCNKEIEKERLETIPEAKFCLTCIKSKK